MCKCGQKTDGTNCDSKEQTGAVEPEQKKTGSCADGHDKNSDCCSTKSA